MTNRYDWPIRTEANHFIFLLNTVWAHTHNTHHSFIHSFDDGGVFVGGLVHTLSPRYNWDSFNWISPSCPQNRGKWRIQRGESQTNKQTNETNNTSNDVVEETTIDKIPSSKTLPTQIPKYVTLHCCCCEQMDRSKSITIFQLRCCCCEQMDRSKSITSIFQTIFITMWWGGGNVQVQSPKSKPVRGGHPPARPPTLEPHQVGGSSPPRV